MTLYTLSINLSVQKTLIRIIFEAHIVAPLTYEGRLHEGRGGGSELVRLCVRQDPVVNQDPVGLRVNFLQYF